MRRKLILHFPTLVILLAFTGSAPANALYFHSAQIVGGNIEEHFRIDGASALDQLGYVLGTGGDVNADGTFDYIISSPRIDHSGTDNGGAFVYSGADDSLLYSFFGNPGCEFGWAVAIGGDLNNDGFDDILIGAPGTPFGSETSAGVVYAYSGADGTELLQVGATVTSFFGGALCGTGDVDFDGYDDFLVGITYGGPAIEGQVQLVSGATGLAITTVTGDNTGDSFGSCLANVGDMNQDGYADFAVGSPYATNLNKSYAGKVHLLSGIDLSQLWKVESFASEDFFGTDVAALPDLNQDGTADVIVGIPGHNSYLGAAQVLSGIDGSVLLSLDGNDQYGYFGFAVANAGDFDGDLIPEIMVGEPLSTVDNEPYAGAVYIYSGVNGSLIHTEGQAAVAGRQTGWAVANLQGGATLSSRRLAYSSPNDSSITTLAGSCNGFGFNPFMTAPSRELSRSAGGVITYVLDFPSDAAGDIYQLLASTHGTGPILFPNNVYVPLALDILLVQTYQGQLPPIVLNGMGTLDANGDGLITLNAPAGVIPSPPIGTKYFLATACRSGLDLWRYSSIALTLEITP